MSTIREVAQRAQVSVKTVSRVLSNQPGVRPETRRRIEQVMEDMEYFPSAAARRLRGHGTGTIAVLVDDLSQHATAEIVRGIGSVCEAEDKIMLLGETGGSRESFGRIVSEFRRHRPEAVIYASAELREVHIEQPFRRTPLVLVNCFEPSLHHATVLPDEAKAAFDLVDALVDRGYRRVHLVGPQCASTAQSLRLEGMRRALIARDLSADDALLCDPSAKGDIALVPLDRLAGGDARTALLFEDDAAAMRGLMVTSRRGMDVPEQLSIVGYGDREEITERTLPTLSSVALPYFEMGAQALRIALEPHEAAEVFRMPCEVVFRGSVR